MKSANPGVSSFDNEVTLFLDKFWISPYSFSSYVALTEKNVSFDIVEISLDEEQQKTKEYIGTSYTGRVPSLRYKSFQLAESSAIAEFLEEMFFDSGVPLFPQKREDRALARMIMAWLRSDFQCLRSERPTHTMFYSRTNSKLSSKAIQELLRLIAFCDRMIGHHTSLFGQWSLADAELSFMLHRLILNRYELPKMVVDYAAANWNRASVRSFFEHHRPPYIPY